jgi:hypothetical protein
MIPIFEQGHGQGIGLSFENFLRHFIEICEAHLENGRAKAFAFILYDFNDKHIKNDILKKQGGFAQLDRLSGRDLSIFYLHSNNRELFKAFNEIFLDTFEIETQYNLPFVLFFKVIDREVTDIEVVELEQTNLAFAFKELYDIIENYIARTNNNNLKKFEPEKNKITEFIKTIKKVGFEQFIKWIIDKLANSAYEHIR